MLRLLLVALVCARVASAQPLGAWGAYSAAARIGGTPVSLHGDVQLRSHALLRDFDQVVLRVGVGVAVRGVRLTPGLAVSYSERPGMPDRPRAELRFYQDVAGGHSVGAVRLDHRGRVEERFVEGEAGYFRLRYQIAASAPIAGVRGQRGAVTAFGSVEPFVRGPGRGTRDAFDRVRLSAGVGVRAARPLDVRAGVLVQQFRSATDVQVQLSLHHSLKL